MRSRDPASAPARSTTAASSSSVPSAYGRRGSSRAAVDRDDAPAARRPARRPSRRRCRARRRSRSRPGSPRSPATAASARRAAAAGASARAGSRPRCRRRRRPRRGGAPGRRRAPRRGRRVASASSATAVASAARSARRAARLAPGGEQSSGGAHGRRIAWASATPVAPMPFATSPPASAGDVPGRRRIRQAPRAMTAAAPPSAHCGPAASRAHGSASCGLIHMRGQRVGMPPGEHADRARVEVPPCDELPQPDAVVVPGLGLGRVADVPACSAQPPHEVDVLADDQRLVEPTAQRRRGGRTARCSARRASAGRERPGRRAGPMSSAEWRSS